MGGVSGVYAAKVVVLGAGVSGMNAAAIALGMQAEVLLLDKNVARLREADRSTRATCRRSPRNTYEIERACLDADLVIGAVLVPGAKAPTLVTDDLVSRMKPGSVLVDISVDQGGCFESTRPTTHSDPTFAVARLAVLLRGEHARRGAAHLHLRADQRHAALRHGAGQPRLEGTRCSATSRWRMGVNTVGGELVYGPVAEAHGLPWRELDEVLS